MTQFDERRKFYAKEIEDRKNNPAICLTMDMRGKMEAMGSCSTAAKDNLICQGRIEKAIEDIKAFSQEAAEIIERYMLPSEDKRHLTGTQTADRLTAMGCPICVCIFCYADRSQEWQKEARNKFAANLAYFTEDRTIDEIPTIPTYKLPRIDGAPVFRIEAEGDTESATHAFNYLQMCEKNPEIRFTAWTKNPAHYLVAIIRNGRKPKNLQLVLSSPYVNKPDYGTFEKYNRLYNEMGFAGLMFDRIFTVYTKTFIKAAGLVANCCRLGEHGKTKCLRDCGACYARLNTVGLVSGDGKPVDNGRERIEILR